MPLLSRLVASSAVALAGLLLGAPAEVNALATGSHALGHINARQVAGISPNHNALARRVKRNAHKNRKRCQQRPPADTGSNNNTGSTDNNTGSNTGSTDSSNNNTNNNSNNNNSGNTGTTQPPSNPTSGPNKLLLAWPNGYEDTMGSIFTGHAIYYYSWSPHKAGGYNGPVKFCPMLWGYNQVYDFQQLVKPGYADCVLGPNEPNQGDQSNINTDQGAELWNTYIGPLASQGYNILGSPAPTSAPNGLTWVQEWLTKVNVKPNVICLHYYDVSADDFIRYVTNFYQNTGFRTIWVTEYACQNFNGGAQCTHDQIWDFVIRTTQWMDAQSWVGAYAPFGFMRDMVNVNYENQLMGNDGHPTDLGNYFIYNS